MDPRSLSSFGRAGQGPENRPSHSGSNAVHQEPKGGLNILVMDGGGVRAYSSLLILQCLMDDVNRDREPDTRLKPCDVFDLMGGTSAGGLNVLMLGVLRMDVSESRAAFKELMPQIFAEPRKYRPLLKNPLKIRSKYDNENIRKAVTTLLERQGLREDTPLLSIGKDGPSDQCRTFVCTLAKSTQQTRKLRSYDNGHDDPDLKATIVEAAMATAAAPRYFDPVLIGDQKFIDGGLGANNPVAEAWEEAEELWGDFGTIEDNINCLVSIGTGHQGLKEWKDQDVPHLAKSAAQIATDSNRAAASFMGQHKSLCRSGKLFRLDVEQGLQRIGLDEHSRIGRIQQVTHEYLSFLGVNGPPRRCAERLRLDNMRRPALLPALAAVPGQPVGLDAHGDSRRVSPELLGHSIVFGSWQFEQEAFAIERCESEEYIHAKLSPIQKNVSVVMLHGVTGCGTTHLAVSYVRRYEQDYSHRIRINGSSASTFEATMKELANFIRQVDRSWTAQVAGNSPRAMTIREDIDSITRWLNVPGNHHWIFLIDGLDGRTSPPNSAGRSTSSYIHDFIGTLNQGSVILTSRLEWQGPHLLRVTKMLPNEATSLLAAILRNVDNAQADNTPGIEKLAAKLHYHARSISNAGQCIAKEGTLNIDEFLEKWNSKTDHSILRYSPDNGKSLAVSFSLAFDELQEDVTEFVKLCACFNYKDISMSLFLTPFGEVSLRRFVKSMREACLFTNTPCENKVHQQDQKMAILPAVHKYAQSMLWRGSEEEVIKKLEAALEVIGNAYAKRPYPENRSFIQRLSKHANICAKYIGHHSLKSVLWSENALRNMSQLANIRLKTGRYRTAQKLYSIALHGYEAISCLGEDYLRVIYDRGLAKLEQGNFDQAAKILHRVLKEAQSLQLQPRGVSLQTVQSHLEIALKDTHDLVSAKDFLEYTSEHHRRGSLCRAGTSRTALYEYGVATLCLKAGDAFDAVSYAQSALAKLGDNSSDHICKPFVLQLLARIHRRRGELGPAERLLVRASDQLSTQYKTKSSQILDYQRQLLHLCRAQCRALSAAGRQNIGGWAKLHERSSSVLQSHKTFYGDDHPRTLQVTVTHGLACLNDDKADAGERCLSNVYQIYNRKHPAAKDGRSYNYALYYLAKCLLEQAERPDCESGHDECVRAASLLHECIPFFQRKRAAMAEWAHLQLIRALRQCGTVSELHAALCEVESFRFVHEKIKHRTIEERLSLE